jgi:2-oxoglutarate ferredoxin oxidoreductase subunit alpha
VPFDDLVKPVCPDAKLRRLVRNMIYDGVLSNLLGIEMGEMDIALARQLGKKAKAVTLNQAALKVGYDYAAQHLAKRDPFRVERMDKTRGKILIEANAAIAVGAMMAGVTVVTWYPITPSSTVVETLIEYLKKYRMDPETGKATFAVVQAEDELASVGMAIGAGWAGARSMTSTSGPGISLMSEFVGLAYYTDVPTVIVNVQRLGPSTGLPTRTAQGDILSTAVLSHGDTKHIMLIPSSAEECYAFTMTAFDLAERFQTPVFVMTDLDLGMNTWMSDAFPYPDKPLDRGKRLDAPTLAGLKEWGRYMDVDGDGIPWRTVPGDGMPSYFNRGSGHNAKGQYSERAEDYTANVDRLAKKFETARSFVPVEDTHVEAGAEIALVAYGSSHASVEEARDQLLSGAGIKTSYMRLKSYPFTKEVEQFIDRHKRVYVIEQNRDAQMLSLLKLDLTPSQVGKLRSVLYYTGLPIDARSISDEVQAQESETVKA